MSVDIETTADGVAVLTLNAPATRNALTAKLGQRFEAAVQEIGGRASVRAVVVTGAGSAFSAGGDLGMLVDLAHRARAGFDATATMRAFYRSFLSVRDIPVPTIAAISGHAIGAGLCLALACDLRIVAAGARVGLNFAQLGLHPGMGASWLAPRVLGAEVAAAWLYAGRLYSGTEAAEQGLALEAVPAGAVLDRALDLAHTIATSAPDAVRQLKATLRGVDDSGFDEALDREAHCQAEGLRLPETAVRLDRLRRAKPAGRGRGK